MIKLKGESEMKRLNRDEIRLRLDFMKGQKYTFEDLCGEISVGHYATAHRLAHTLKGISGLIGECELSAIALKIEKQLRDKQTPDELDMQTLESELNRVLKEISDSGIDDGTFNTPPTKEEQTILFDKLQPLLADADAACIQLIPEIAVIYETRVLVHQIENYDYKQALITLKVLREVLGV
jgi:HPt (histidine-containing phosphotransfer) domain-containing protein